MVLSLLSDRFPDDLLSFLSSFPQAVDASAPKASASISAVIFLLIVSSAIIYI